MNSFSRVLLAVVALVFGACYPESRNPIAPASMNVNDAALEGTWCIRDKDKTVFYHMHHSGKDARGRMGVVGIEVPKGEKAMEQVSIELVTARLGGVPVLSFRNMGAKDAKTFSFMRYELDWRGRLNLWMADSGVFGDAVLAGKLRGTAKKGQFGTVVTLTDSSERIAAFIAAAGVKSVFSSDPIVMEKVR